jgi:hypothetical protein
MFMVFIPNMMMISSSQLLQEKSLQAMWVEAAQCSWQAAAP